ncbi:MAG: hypothetical protein ACRC6H_07135 [Culicoidibacterales bacterium]
MDRLKKLNIKDFDEIVVSGGCNCAFKSICKAVGISESNHRALREKTSEIIRNEAIDAEIISVNGYNSKEEWPNEIGTMGKWIGYEALYYLFKHLKIGLVVYLKDQRYVSDPWCEVNESINSMHKYYAYISLFQGNYMDQDLDGHFQA